MSKKTIIILKAARNLFDSNDRWCQNTDALDFHGNEVMAESHCAYSWCILGAIQYVSYPDVIEADLAKRELWNALPNVPANCRSTIALDVADYNDCSERQFLDVIALFDRAIQQAENFYN